MNQEDGPRQCADCDAQLERVVEGKVFVMHRSGKGVLYDAADELDSNGKVIGRRVSIVTLEGK